VEKNNKAAEKNRDPDTGCVLAQLQYSKNSKQIETYNQIAIEQPISINTCSINPDARPILFTGQSKEVFWFSKRAQGGYNINILEAESVKVESTQINEDSQLHKYLANETPCITVEYGLLETLPQAEPTMVSLDGKKNVFYSYFALGDKPSVCAYCPELRRDMLQI